MNSCMGLGWVRKMLFLVSRLNENISLNISGIVKQLAMECNFLVKTVSFQPPVYPKLVNEKKSKSEIELVSLEGYH